MRRAVCVALLASLVAGVQLPCSRTTTPRACAVPTEKLRAPRRARGAPPIREQGRATPQRELQRLQITGGEWRGRRLLTRWTANLGFFVVASVTGIVFSCVETNQ